MLHHMIVDLFWAGFWVALYFIFVKKADCPACGKSGWKVYKLNVCADPNCRAYIGKILEIALTAMAKNSAGAQTSGPKDPRTGKAHEAPRAAKPKKVPVKRPFVLGPDAFKIEYVNHKGEKKTFTGDGRTVLRLKKTFSARMAPTGKRLNFLIKSVQNLAEVQAFADRNKGAKMPRGRDKQVLAYHYKYGTSSPLFNEIRQKYPYW